MLVIADTSPINYLVAIEFVGILPQLYGRIIKADFLSLSQSGC